MLKLWTVTAPPRRPQERPQRVGGVLSLPPETIKAAQEAAEAAGEDVPVFVARAIESRATLGKRKRR